jgi:hypothetical protein
MHAWEQREVYSFAMPMAINGIYLNQKMADRAVGQHGKAKDIHLSAGDKTEIGFHSLAYFDSKAVKTPGEPGNTCSD